MKDLDSWHLVGFVKEAHSLKGELYVVVPSEDTSWSQGLTEALIGSSLSDQTIRLHIKRARPHKKGLILLTEEISNRTEAETCKGYQFYIPKNQLHSQKGDALYLAEILHFELFNEQGERQGQVVGFSGSPLQDTVIVRYDGGEFEIPLVEELIHSINFENKSIIMTVPEGLKDLK